MLAIFIESFLHKIISLLAVIQEWKDHYFIDVLESLAYTFNKQIQID
jgi:hypothetical protein